MPSIEEVALEVAIETVAAAEPRKKHLRFTIVEGSPPTDTYSLALAKLSQYSEGSGLNSRHSSVLIEVEVRHF